MPGSTIDYSIGDMFDEVSKRRTSFSTLMRPGVDADEPFLASLHFVDNASARAGADQQMPAWDEESSYDNDYRGLRDQEREGPSSREGSSNTGFIDVRARREFFESLSTSQHSTMTANLSDQTKKFEDAIMVGRSNSDSFGLDAPSDDSPSQKTSEVTTPAGESPAESLSPGEAMASRIIRDQLRVKLEKQAEELAQQQLEEQFDQDFKPVPSACITTTRETTPPPPPPPPQRQVEAPPLARMDVGPPRFVDVRIFETKSPKTPTYSEPVIADIEIVENGPQNPSQCDPFAWTRKDRRIENEATTTHRAEALDWAKGSVQIVDNGPLHPSRCEPFAWAKGEAKVDDKAKSSPQSEIRDWAKGNVEIVDNGPADPSKCEAFAWAKDEANVMLCEFASWLGVPAKSKGAVAETEWDVKGAIQPAHSEAKMVIKEMTGWLSTTQAKKTAAETDWDVKALIKPAHSEAKMVVKEMVGWLAKTQPEPCSAAEAIEPAREEAKSVMTEMAGCLAANQAYDYDAAVVAAIQPAHSEAKMVAKEMSEWLAHTQTERYYVPEVIEPAHEEAKLVLNEISGCFAENQAYDCDASGVTEPVRHQATRMMQDIHGFYEEKKQEDWDFNGAIEPAQEEAKRVMHEINECFGENQEWGLAGAIEPAAEEAMLMLDEMRVSCV